jgi:ATP adenylyltransferase
MPAPYYIQERLYESQMEQLWAPWRLAYVSAAKRPGEAEECFICQGLEAGEDRRHLIALRTPLSVVVLNRFPYNNGHLLVAPRSHKAQLADLDGPEVLEITESIRRMIAILDRSMHPDGYNIGLNLGASAGAGLPGHLHWHIVPRWRGDTNFMPTIADTKVLPQSLDSLYDLLVSQLSSQTT